MELYVHVKQFGAGGIGEDDTAAIQAAIDAHPGQVIHLGRYHQISPPGLIINKEATLLTGGGEFFGGTTLEYTGTTGNMITINGAGHHAGLRDTYLRYAGQGTSNPPTAGSFFLISSGVFCPQVKNVRMDYGYNGITIDGGVQVDVVDVKFRYLFGEAGILVKGTSLLPTSGVNLQNIQGDNPYPQGPNGTVKTWATLTVFSVGDTINHNNNIYQCVQGGTSAPGGIGPAGTGAGFFSDIIDGNCRWRFVCQQDFTWVRQDSFGYSLRLHGAVALIGGAYGFRMTDSLNTGTSYPQWAYMDRPESDHPFFACINLERGEGVHIDQGWFGSCRTGNGVNIQATHRGEVVLGASRIMGHWQSGVFLAAGPVDVHIGAGCEIGDNSVQGANLFSGITIDAGASRFNFSHFRSGNLVGVLGNFQGYGMVIGNNCSDYTIDDFNLDGNGLGPMLVGTGQVRGYIGDGTPFPRSQWLQVTVNAGNTTGSTPHGMGATPQIVGSLTARNDSGNNPRLWTTADATNVTVNASAALTNTTVFDVMVRRTS